MAKTIKFSISLDKNLVKKLDDYIFKEKLPSRSGLISELISKYITERKSVEGNNVAGVISFVYNHNKKFIGDILTSIQHKYNKIIVSSQHVHLTKDICFEIVIVRGKGKDIENLYRDIKKVKGILNSYFNIASEA
ncbi:MAG: CopG family ribbon-helix-helix protein [Elusimicrobiales bacterium]|nr:CopG family ribbon-helix-helix protein [Elusimicrobiales bacterium]